MAEHAFFKIEFFVEAPVEDIPYLELFGGGG